MPFLLSVGTGYGLFLEEHSVAHIWQNLSFLSLSLKHPKLVLWIVCSKGLAKNPLALCCPVVYHVSRWEGTPVGQYWSVALTRHDCSSDHWSRVSSHHWPKGLQDPCTPMSTPMTKHSKKVRVLRNLKAYVREPHVAWETRIQKSLPFSQSIQDFVTSKTPCFSPSVSTRFNFQPFPHHGTWTVDSATYFLCHKRWMLTQTPVLFPQGAHSSSMRAMAGLE